MSPVDYYYGTFMKTLIVLSLFALTACDAPVKVRTAPTDAFSGSINTSGNGSTGFNLTPGTGGTTTGTTNGGTTTGSTTGSSGGINCIKTVTAFHSGLGSVDVCQDSANEVMFRLGFNTTDQSDGTCVVPMFRDSSGNSLYLGNAQCTKHNQGQVVTGQLDKNRQGYAGYQINSVMVLKYSGTNAFFQCMNAYGSQYNGCMSSFGGNPFYQSYCQSQAQTYMTTICNTFKSSYPYSQVLTR